MLALSALGIVLVVRFAAESLTDKALDVMLGVVRVLLALVLGHGTLNLIFGKVKVRALDHVVLARAEMTATELSVAVRA